jgi:hypothetical protein
MTKTEFIAMIQEYAKKEMTEQTTKANEAQEKGEVAFYWAHVGASNEAEKFFNIIVRSFVQD